MVITKKVDQSGKAYITNSLAGKQIRLVVEEIKEDEVEE